MGIPVEALMSVPEWEFRGLSVEDSAVAEVSALTIGYRRPKWLAPENLRRYPGVDRCQLPILTLSSRKVLPVQIDVPGLDLKSRGGKFLGPYFHGFDPRRRPPIGKDE